LKRCHVQVEDSTDADKRFVGKFGRRPKFIGVVSFSERWQDLAVQLTTIELLVEERNG